MRIVWSPQAIEDLQSLRAYISRENPPAAAVMASTIVAQVSEQLPAFPQSGRPGRVENTRELVIPGTSYVVPYRVDGGTIFILAVHHSARRWLEEF